MRIWRSIWYPKKESAKAIPVSRSRSCHGQLAALSQQTDETTAAGDPSAVFRASTARVQKIEAKIDELAVELWGLTGEEIGTLEATDASG